MERVGSGPATLARAVEPHLTPETSVKVKVLEGARAVGKTTVVERLVNGGVYDHRVDLADPATLRIATKDTSAFLADLPERTVIDEAQLIDDLPLHIKRLVDEYNTPRRFLLTGSSRIGRQGLGGTDPLTGRVERWTLDPFTTSERIGAPEQLGRIVDDLFQPQSRIPENTPRTRTPADWIHSAGLPQWTLNPITQARRMQHIEDWRTAIVHSGLPASDGRMSPATATRVLDVVLLRTAIPLIPATIANQLEIDVRTVVRYLEFFERRFLFRRLPNLALAPHQQGVRGAKVHAIDAGLTQAALRATDPGLLKDPQWMGQLFETWVVNQLLAARPFSRLRPDAFTWRTVPRGHFEVDLVLVSPDGRRVGIEVKSGSSVGPQDIRGLSELSKKGSFHAGYVVHTGTSVEQLGERIWALPAGLLVGDFTTTDDDGTRQGMDPRLAPWAVSRQSLGPPQKGPDGVGPTPEEPHDARVFLSYVHADNAILGNAITTFAKNLEAYYGLVTGGSIKVFTDQTDLLWGERWGRRIEAEIGDTDFLIAAVTPRFLKSTACRDEVTRFLSRAEVMGQPRLLLPLIVQSIEDVEGVPANDSVRVAIAESQWLDLTGDFEALTGDTAEGRQRMRGIAEALSAVIKAREALTVPSPSVGGSERGEDPLSLGSLRQGESAADEETLDGFFEEHRLLEAGFESAANRFGASLARVMEALTPVFDEGGYTNPGILASARHALDPLVGELEADTRDLSAAWAKLSAPLREVLAGTRVFMERDDKDRLRADLFGLAESLSFEDADEVMGRLRIMGEFSRMLRPSMRAVAGAIEAVNTIRTSVEALAAELG
ncbi:MAG: DUF4143 domain-containing protein [Micrococcales bacterium]|nr:DUF4143 domain-containing protein [Micrococcales bacterium]